MNKGGKLYRTQYWVCFFLKRCYFTYLRGIDVNVL